MATAKTLRKVQTTDILQHSYLRKSVQDRWRNGQYVLIYQTKYSCLLQLVTDFALLALRKDPCIASGFIQFGVNARFLEIYLNEKVFLCHVLFSAKKIFYGKKNELKNILKSARDRLSIKALQGFQHGVKSSRQLKKHPLPFSCIRTKKVC